MPAQHQPQVALEQRPLQRLLDQLVPLLLDELLQELERTLVGRALQQVSGPGPQQRFEAVLAVRVAIRPDADVRIIPGAGHWVQYEAPDAVNAIVLERLRATQRVSSAG